jgi:hypothetical protein
MLDILALSNVSDEFLQRTQVCGRGFRGGQVFLLDGLVNFMPVNCNLARGDDADFNVIPLDAQNPDLDFSADDQAFPSLARENQQSSTPPDLVAKKSGDHG